MKLKATIVALVVVGIVAVPLWLVRQRGQKGQQRNERVVELATLANVARHTREDPLNPALRAQLGSLLAQMGRIEEAERAFQVATQLDGRFAPAWTGLGQTALLRGRPVKAARALERAASLVGDEHLVLLELARAQLRARHFDDALATARRVVKLYPKDPEAHLALSAVYYDTSRASDALKEAEKAHQLDPKSPSPCFVLTRQHTLSGRLKEGVEWARKAIALAPNRAEGYELLSAALVKGRWNNDVAKEVESSARRILQIQPDNPAGHYYLGFVKQQLEQWKEAQSPLEKAFKLNPRSPEVAHALGQVYLHLGMEEKGEKVLDEYERLKVTEDPRSLALELQAAQTDDLDTHWRLALLYQRRGMLENAMEQAEFVLRRSPRHAPAHLLFLSAARRLRESEILEKHQEACPLCRGK
jgi:tetratricopeptide (TPR) repeat protein